MVSRLLTSHLFPLHQIFIYGTTVLPQLHRFWNSLWSKIAQVNPYVINPYITNIRDMRLQLPELQDNNKEAKALRLDAVGFPEGWKDDKGVLQYQSLLYVLEIICSKVITCHHNDLFTRHFRIDKTWELVIRKYYWPTFYRNIKIYIQGCNVCLASKTV